jgi:hypothetical protein
MAAKRPPNATEILPNGLTVDYWDTVGVDGERQQRRYRVDGDRYLSISSAAGIFDKPGLMPAAVKLQEHGVIALAQAGVDIAAQTQESLRALLVERGLHYDSVWQVARDRGDVAHDHLVGLIRDGKVAKLSQFAADLRPWISAGMRYALDTRPKVIAAEQMVACSELRVAGRFDLFSEARDGALERTDYKTVTEWKAKKDWKGNPTDQLLPPYDENLLQIIGYERTARSCGFEAADRLKVVRLGPDGEYDVTEVPYRPEAFEAAVTAYHARKGLLEPLAGVTA